jgi:hypothetical protein
MRQTTLVKTPIGADQLRYPSYRLLNLLSYRRIARPARDSSGDYLWSADDLERARVAVLKIDARRQRRGVTA